MRGIMSVTSIFQTYKPALKYLYNRDRYLTISELLLVLPSRFKLVLHRKEDARDPYH